MFASKFCPLLKLYFFTTEAQRSSWMRGAALAPEGKAKVADAAARERPENQQLGEVADG